jgi:hypothetical protein
MLSLTFCVVLCFAMNAGSSTAQARAEGKNTQTIFQFHSGFWINLHHFLYWQALAAAPQKGPHRLALNSADAEELKLLSAGETASWDTAVAYYQGSLIQHDLLFDQGMEAVKNQLEDSEASPDLRGVHVPGELKEVLLKAALIYRKHWWPKQDAQNRQWITQLQPLIEEHGEAMRNSLTKIYEASWPRQPVRVDAVAYANWAGAYTTLEPTRSTISTADPANQGAAALEIVFHESSHGMMNEVMNAINSAEKAVNARSTNGAFHFRRDLWHEVLFYTSGELVAERIAGYVPFADKNGLWTRAWPGPDRALIERDWKPHMNGTVGLQQSLTTLVNDLVPVLQHK